MSIEIKCHMAHLECKQESINLQKKKKKMMALSISLGSLQSTIDRAKKRALLGCSVYDSTHELWVRVHELEAEAKVLQEKLSCFAENSPPPNRTKTIITLPTNEKPSDFFDNCKSPPINLHGMQYKKNMVLCDLELGNITATDEECNCA